MNVRILFFAATADLVGARERAVTLPPTVRTVADLARWLEEREPALRGHLDAVRLARNEAFATGDEALADGDTIALIPPVAGG